MTGQDGVSVVLSLPDQRSVKREEWLLKLNHCCAVIITGWMTCMLAVNCNTMMIYIVVIPDLLFVNPLLLSVFSFHVYLCC